MKYEIVHLEEFSVAGLAARTNNASPDMGAVIGGLWNRFYSDGIYSSLPHKTTQKAMGIYTDYTQDEKSDYTILTACEVSSDIPRDSLPSDVVIRRFPAATYAKFVVKGPMDTAVTQFWQELWTMDLPRTFICDFEEYQNSDMEQAEIHMYISISNPEEELRPQSRCGINCDTCNYKDSMNCQGCIKIENPFWADDKGCPVKQCCENKSLLHCGLCGEFPCDMLTGFSYQKEQGDDGLRILQCKLWRCQK